MDNKIELIPDKRVRQGALVIAGGNIKQAKNVIDAEFVALAGGTNNAKIVIVPASSGYPTTTFFEMKQDLISSCGLSDEQIVMLEVAMVDDPETKEIDESLWMNGAYLEKEVEKLEGATGVWFVGGDQSRVVKLLRNGTNNTPVLQKIYDLFERGNFVIGGTSAGAAIMSKVMINGGESLGALSHEHIHDYSLYSQDLEQLGILCVNEDGFNFFKQGVIDQHFNMRSRLGRLIEAAYVEGNKTLGFGISENTAMVYNHETKEIHCIGSDGILIVDTSASSRSKLGYFSHYKNIRLSYLRNDASYHVITKQFNYPEENRIIVTNKNISKPIFGGVLSRTEHLYQFIGEKLIDNHQEALFYDDKRKLYYIKGYAYYDDHIVYEVRFYRDSNTLGYYSPVEKAYSFTHVIMDMIPIRYTFKEMSEEDEF